MLVRQFICEKSLVLLFLFISSYLGYVSIWWFIVVWHFIHNKSLVHMIRIRLYSAWLMRYHSPRSNYFESMISYYYIIWYDWEFLEAELLNICHCLVYMSDWDGVAHISLSAISRVHMNIVDTDYSTCP